MIFSHSSDLKRARLLLPAASKDEKGRFSFEGWTPSLHSPKLLEQAAINEEQQVRLLRNFTIACLFFFLLFLVTKNIFVFSGVVLTLLFQRSQIGKKAKARTESFERDYPALLLALSSSMKSGLDPLVALQKTKDLFPEGTAMHQELSAFDAALDGGESEEGAIQLFGSTVQHSDIDLFRAAFLLSRREGSSLGQSLRRLARVSRQRQSFRRKIRTAVALQKLSAIGIGSCTVLIGIIQGVSNPDSMITAFTLPIGQQLLGLGLGLIVVGNIWIFRLAKVEF